LLILTTLDAVQIEEFALDGRDSRGVSNGWLIHVAVAEQIPAQRGDQITQRPTKGALKLQNLEQQDRDQCCPNLDANRIGASSYENLYLQVLFEGLEKQFNLPAFPVNVGDRVGCELQLVSQQLVLVVREGDPRPRL
jgi:hypothetical protein